jgi:hypothetical protein
MSIEAMKQSLEALEFFKDTAICSADTDVANEAITSLRQAIAEAEKQEPVAWRVTYRDFENIPQLIFLPHEVHPDSPLAKNGKNLMQEPLYTHPQPKQEPVAMRYDFDGYGYKYIDNGSGSDWQTRIKDAEPVFAHPQPKQGFVE